MPVYCFVIIGLGFLALLNEANEYRMIDEGVKPQKIIAFLMVTLLALVAGLRYNVGTDYFSYYSGYAYFKNASLALNDEPGIKIIAKVASVIYDDPATMMFLAAAITVVLMTTTILKNSDLYWLSILLYMFLGCWHGCFNGIRQYLASAVLFAGHVFIKERKLWKWLVVVFIASMCHITAVIGVAFYFYPQLKISFKNVAVSIVAAFVGINLYDKIFGFIGFLKDDTFDFTGVGSGYLTNSINPLRIAVAWIPVIFFLVFQKYYDKENAKLKFYFNMSLLHAVLMTTAINSTYLGRVGIYTGIYNTITWPILLQKVEPQSKRILVVLMLVLYALYWSMEARGETLVHFQWIFQR